MDSSRGGIDGGVPFQGNIQMGHKGMESSTPKISGDPLKAEQTNDEVVSSLKDSYEKTPPSGKAPPRPKAALPAETPRFPESEKPVNMPALPKVGDLPERKLQRREGKSNLKGSDAPSLESERTLQRKLGQRALASNKTGQTSDAPAVHDAAQPGRALREKISFSNLPSTPASSAPGLLRAVAMEGETISKVAPRSENAKTSFFKSLGSIFKKTESSSMLRKPSPEGRKLEKKLEKGEEPGVRESASKVKFGAPEGKTDIDYERQKKRDHAREIRQEYLSKTLLPKEKEQIDIVNAKIARIKGSRELSELSADDIKLMGEAHKNISDIKAKALLNPENAAEVRTKMKKETGEIVSLLPDNAEKLKDRIPRKMEKGEPISGNDMNEYLKLLKPSVKIPFTKDSKISENENTQTFKQLEKERQLITSLLIPFIAQKKMEWKNRPPADPKAALAKLSSEFMAFAYEQNRRVVDENKGLNLTSDEKPIELLSSNRQKWEGPLNSLFDREANVIAYYLNEKSSREIL